METSTLDTNSSIGLLGLKLVIRRVESFRIEHRRLDPNDAQRLAMKIVWCMYESPSTVTRE